MTRKTTSPPIRGAVHWMDLGHGTKPWLIISNNVRNRNLDTVLVARVTTTLRDLPTRVTLTKEDPLIGQVLCDDVEQVGSDELGNRVGALSPATMRRVRTGLMLALGLDER